MGTVPRAGGERDRPGLPVCHDSTEALWPVPGPWRGRATGTAVHHPPSSHQRLRARQGHYTDGVGAGWERAWRVGPGGGGGHTGEGDDPGSFTQMKSRDTDTESEDTTPGRDSWRSAQGRETVLLTTPRTRGQGKRRMELGGGTTKRPRMESSSSERRDESEESRYGGTRDRPGRGGRRAARPMTPPHRPPPPSTSPCRSPRLSQPSAAGDLRRLPLSAKSNRRTAHSRPAIQKSPRGHRRDKWQNNIETGNGPA